VKSFWIAVAAFLSSLAVPADAAPPHPGLWALKSGDVTLFQIELRHDAQGWSATWIRPDRFSLRGEGFYALRPPVVRRRSLSARIAGDGLEVSFDDPHPNSVPDVLVLRAKDAGRSLADWHHVFRDVLLVREAPGAPLRASWPAETRYPWPVDRPSDAEMKRLFEADQAARLAPGRIDWEIVAKEDLVRRNRTRELLAAGALKSGDDFWHAAFIFQHGGEASDYLLAHTLAVVAVARDRPDATWIAAATLDRYLQKIGQKQIYGTQFRTNGDAPTTQEPYDRALVSDALREALGVPNQAGQDKQRAQFEAQFREQRARPK
jgi:hypothetical protein